MSYVEKKQRKQKIRIAIFVSVAVIITTVGCMFILGVNFLHWAAISFLSLVILIGVLICCYYLGIKLPKAKEPEWLLREAAELEKMVDNLSRQIREKSRNEVNERNSSCPLCHRKKIVDKIADVSGSVSGSFSLGFGSVSGKTGTSGVNHCSDCGHQWKKSESIDYSESKEDALYSILRPMYNYFFENDDAGLSRSDPLKRFKAKSVSDFLFRHYSYHRAEKLFDHLSLKDLVVYGCQK